MMDHAAGALPPALHMAGDLHRALDGDGHRTAAVWESLGGLLLEAAPIGAGTANRRSAATRFARPAVSVDQMLSEDLDQLDWRRGMGGVQQAKTGVPMGSFMRLEPHQMTPAHGHTALEATVVLEGELVIDDEVYRKGHLVLGVPGERHQPMGGNCGTCICYVGRERRPFWRLS